MSQPSTQQTFLQTCLGRQGVQELLLACLSAVPDKRVERTKKFPLVYILFAALCTFITGGKNFYDMEYFARDCKDFLDKITGCNPDSHPSHDTFNRVFKLIDNKKMLDLLRDTVELLMLCMQDNNKDEHYACDGKYLRGSIDADSHMHGILNIWSSKYGMIVFKEPVDEKS